MVFGRPLILVMPVLGDLRIDLAQLKDDATPKFMPGGNIGVILSSILSSGITYKPPPLTQKRNGRDCDERKFSPVLGQYIGECRISIHNINYSEKKPPNPLVSTL